MKIGLILLFGFTALLYASVGFGGGSTYNALLVMSGADYRVIPIVALACNIVVVTANVMRYERAGLIPWKRIWPLLLASVPAAAVGGRLPISEDIFILLLAAALTLAGLRLLWPQREIDVTTERAASPLIMSVIGGGIGFCAGLVGIGGGIFLAPLLHILRWGRAKVIAASCSLFILVNSLSGLAGQVSKLSDAQILPMLQPYLPLIPAVLIGGLAGNYLGAFKLSDMWVKRLTGILILYVAVRLWLRVISGG